MFSHCTRLEVLVRIVDGKAEADRETGKAQGHHEQHFGERDKSPPGGREDQGLRHDLHALEDLTEALNAGGGPGEVVLLVDGQSLRHQANTELRIAWRGKASGENDCQHADKHHGNM